ncbi:MAG: hypothetical protein LUE98_08825 [Tannerellaceae bacterium]|nr:hypothetical protein [Tannerellaceae bacterium]
MPAYFRIVETPNPNKEKETQYHVRFSSNGTLTINDLMEEITYGTTFTEPDVDGLLSLLKWLLVRTTSLGYNLNLEGIGTFMPSAKCPQGLQKSEINTYNVKISGVQFRPSAELMNQLALIPVRRRKEITKPQYTLEQRRAFIIRYLSRNYHITGKYYREHMVISKTTAAKDLKLFIDEGLIVSEGNGPTTFYRKK